MARIAGVDLPNEKRVEIGLTYIFGIGLSTSKKILAATGVNPDTRVRDLTEDEIQLLRNEIDNYNVEGDLRRDIALDIKRLMEINCYRGMRHRKGLPVRGQRSKTNARTRKGPKENHRKQEEVIFFDRYSGNFEFSSIFYIVRFPEIFIGGEITNGKGS